MITYVFMHSGNQATYQSADTLKEAVQLVGVSHNLTPIMIDEVWMQLDKQKIFEVQDND